MSLIIILLFFLSGENEEIPLNQLNIFVENNMVRYLEIVQCCIDKNTSDTAVLVRALDRFYKKIQVVGKLYSYKDFTLYIFYSVLRKI